MRISTVAFGVDFLVNFSYQVTAAPYRGRSPDLEQPGEPPEPGEFTVSNPWLFRDTPTGPAPAECPRWLLEVLQAYLEEDPDGAVYAAVAEEENW